MHLQIVPLKGEKCITITTVFSKILDESGQKSKIIWVDK